LGLTVEFLGNKLFLDEYTRPAQLRGIHSVNEAYASSDTL